MNEVLTKKTAYKALENFFRQNPFVLFGTGTSCAVDACFGMNALKEHLLKEVPNNQLNNSQLKQWESVVDSLNNGSDLESSMDAVQDESLISIIVESTVKLVASLDRQYSIKILSGELNWPALPLFIKLLDGLSQNNNILHVATTNYDLLAEYAFEKANIPYITGFSGGICRRQIWEQAERSMIHRENHTFGRKLKPIEKYMKHIRLYKVHGSLNTFCLNDTIVENNAWMYDNSANLERIMIVPGMAKYERLHKYRATLLGKYDQAAMKQNAFLFLGFGFNDSQLINETINRKLKEQKCPGLIITRDSNPRIEQYLKECENLWLVCRHKENGNEGSRIYNSRYNDSIIVNDKQLWDLSFFTKEFLGG